MLFEVVSSMVDAWIVLVTSAQSLYGSPGSSKGGDDGGEEKEQ
jgi:hypothetical protein